MTQLDEFIPQNRLSRRDRLLLGFALALKVLSVIYFPLTGDEAYYITWAKELDWGYYDHPPMIAWWIWAIGWISHDYIAFRIPSVIVSFGIAYLVYRLLKNQSADKAKLIALISLFFPMNLIQVAATPDLPLVAFCFLSGFLFIKAESKRSNLFFVLSGICLGLAFLSKFFAALLGLAYVVSSIAEPKNTRRIRGVFIVFLSSLPFVAVNLLWNFGHCWANFLVQFKGRSERFEFEIVPVLTFLLAQLWFVTPFLAFLVIKHARKLRLSVFTFFFIVPMTAFLLLAFVKKVGAHYGLAFYPFIFPLLVNLEQGTLKRLLNQMMGFGLAHVLLLMVIMSIPVEHLSVWFPSRSRDLALTLHPDEVMRALTDRLVAKEYVLASNSYVVASLSDYYSGRDFEVFGRGSHRGYGRQRDLRFDYRNLEGRDIAIFQLSTPELTDEFRALFRDGVSVEEFWVQTFGPFYLVKGKNLSFEKYRDDILRPTRKAFYQIPEGLPRGGCYFDRYFQ